MQLFLSALGGGDDAGNVRRFHGRLAQDTLRVRSANHPDVLSGTIGGLTVSELITRLRSGDRDALALLYDALFSSLWHVAMLQTHASAAADDIVQDTFLWLWTHRDTISPATDLRVYLTAAVRNRARDLGKHKRAVESATLSAGEDVVSGVGQPFEPPDAAITNDDFLRAYQRALADLTERELTAALLRWEEGFTLEQIAHVLGVSPRGAMGVVRRAQAKMQIALADFR